jgi:FolB domain-containing protein
MQINIKNLRVQTIIGAYDWEREKPQELIVNARIDFDGAKAAASDELADALDYKALKERIMAEAEGSRLRLVEKLAANICRLIMEDARVLRADVEVDKPRALSHADSVSVRCSMERTG